MGLTKREREKKKRQLPDNYIPTEEQHNHYMYCLRNNIRISPMGTEDNAVGKWRIGISTPDDYRKVYFAPHIYDKDTIWPSFYNYCKYYYEKQI